jgi:hypothetical protein
VKPVTVTGTIAGGLGPTMKFQLQYGTRAQMKRAAKNLRVVAAHARLEAMKPDEAR